MFQVHKNTLVWLIFYLRSLSHIKKFEHPEEDRIFSWYVSKAAAANPPTPHHPVLFVHWWQKEDQ